MRDIGEPTVTVYVRSATPEEVAENRESLRRVVESICTEVNGYPTKVTIDWDAAKGVYPIAPKESKGYVRAK